MEGTTLKQRILDKYLMGNVGDREAIQRVFQMVVSSQDDNDGGGSV